MSALDAFYIRRVLNQRQYCRKACMAIGMNHEEPVAYMPQLCLANGVAVYILR